jgi:hypothetical protein
VKFYGLYVIYILYNKIRNNKINILVEIREVLRSICNKYIS